MFRFTTKVTFEPTDLDLKSSATEKILSISPPFDLKSAVASSFEIS